jgi:hypothetical protein
MSPALYEASSPFLMIESVECVNENMTQANIYLGCHMLSAACLNGLSEQLPGTILV